MTQQILNNMHNANIIHMLIIALSNLLVPMLFYKYKKICNILTLIIASLFFINIIQINLTFITQDDYIEFYRFHNYSLALHIDNLGLIFLNLIGLLWQVALLYIIGYLDINKISNQGRFLFFINLSVICGIFIALSANLITMFISYEILTLSTLSLILHVRSNNTESSISHYIKMLMITSLALFLPAIIIIYCFVGHGNFISYGFVEQYFSRNTSIVLLLMFIFGISKAAIYPVHSWLPKAMIASYPVSALLHAIIVVKSGLFCIFKIILSIFGLQYLHSIFTEINWIIYFPIITIVYSAYMAIKTNNIKNMLAYSTINQLNMALMSAFLFTKQSMIAAILHMLSHSFTKITLFYGFGAIYSLFSIKTITQLTGIAKHNKFLSISVVIAGLSLIGVPILAGFVSKFYIISASINTENYVVIFALIFSGMCSTYYFIKVIIHMYGDTTQTSHINHLNDQYITTESININLSKKTMPHSMYISIFTCLVCVIFFWILLALIKPLLFGII
ncbi:MAG: proton-conducting transporter membrane subunit [Rickettsiaceae bacterium]